MDSETKNQMDTVYREMSLDEIPWNNEEPPQILVELVESGKIEPCKTIDLGCGAGNYSIYLAGKGFEVTGIDFSPTAIEIAKKNAERKKVKCNFLVGDVLCDLDKIKKGWDFAYEWGLLHLIPCPDRPKYVESVWRLLNDNGKYLSLCFSEHDTYFEGSGKYRETQIGTVLYFSCEEELKELFAPHFKILELRTVEIEGKVGPHVFNYAFMEKKI